MNTSPWMGRCGGWASHKSFRPVHPVANDKKDNEPKPPAPRWDENNSTINYRGEKRSNQTQCSTTGPEAMLAPKGRGKEAKLSCHGHLMTENRNGLVVNTLVTTAYGAAECHAGLLMAEKLPGCGRVTLGADKGYDQHEFIEELRQMEITPMWRKTRVVAGADWTCVPLDIPVMRLARETETASRLMFTLAAAAHNLVRMRTLMPKCA